MQTDPATHQAAEPASPRKYWLVDPELDLVTVFRRNPDGSFPRDAALTREACGVLTSPLMPGLAIPLDDLFAAI